MPKPSKSHRRKAKKKTARKAALTAKHQENRAVKAASAVGVALPPRDTSYLDRLLLDEDGYLRVVPSEVYEGIDWVDLRVWCHKRAFYGLPTTELIEFLREQIGDRTAIEIGSGNGVFGRALDIPRTDSHLQEQPEVALHYLMQGQPLVGYGPDVERLEALEAVQKYDPQVVIGSWVTHWIDPNLPYPPGGGSMYGIREDRLLTHPSVETYMVIGNLDVHGHKPAWKPELGASHVVQAPWLWSRAARPGNNCVMVWEPRHVQGL